MLWECSFRCAGTISSHNARLFLSARDSTAVRRSYHSLRGALRASPMNAVTAGGIGFALSPS